MDIPHGRSPHPPSCLRVGEQVAELFGDRRRVAGNQETGGPFPNRFSYASFRDPDDRCSACHRFERHQAEGLHPRRENQSARPVIEPHQVLLGWIVNDLQGNSSRLC